MKNISEMLIIIGNIGNNCSTNALPLVLYLPGFSPFFVSLTGLRNLKSGPEFQKAVRY